MADDLSERETILAGVRPLIQQARTEGKWLWCSYQDLWFSPDQLEAEHAKGSFIWSAVNWQLRDPAEYLAEARKRTEAAFADELRISREISGG